ncbi:hypothetical protein DFH01_09720 [Falsiroseomonas bella]|uniref:Uncharacterized protein n=2 Tax=Falsiroseomonas bella TaxID=2184016 RepID=A0A317FHW7_9PROT|nr:hypothetical protein DFH01_09720 [Falsiroseomonas bella]
MAELDRRGRRRHEAGVFLLGDDVGGSRVVRDAIFYDQLDPKAYDTGICVLHGAAFAQLWNVCRKRGLTVVADAHTHGGDARQSGSDRKNPMVARPGHIAVIVPDFARGPVLPERLGLYRYLGDHRWTEHGGRRWRRFLSLREVRR